MGDKAIIILNNELGYDMYSVVDSVNHEYWHEAFYDMCSAEEFASNHGLVIVGRWDRRSSV
jgi:hypothetical protein